MAERDGTEEQGRRLGELMDSGTPPPGVSGGERLEAVHQRRRAARGRLLAAGGVTALAVVAGVVIGVNLLDGEGRGTDPAPAMGVEEPVSAPDLECPPGGEWDGADPRAAGGEGSLPEGAVNARLCLGPLGQGGAVDVPEATVTDGVDELVSLVDDSPIDDPAVTLCTMDAGPDYLLLLGYEDGSVVAAAAEDFGCHWVWVGGTARPVAEDLLRTFNELAG